MLLVVVVVVGVVVAQFGSLLGGTTRLINKMCESDATTRRWTLFVLQPQADDAAVYDLLLHTHATVQYPIKPRECRRFRFLPRPTINWLPASVGCPFFQRHGTLQLILRPALFGPFAAALAPLAVLVLRCTGCTLLLFQRPGTATGNALFYCFRFFFGAPCLASSFCFCFPSRWQNNHVGASPTIKFQVSTSNLPLLKYTRQISSGRQHNRIVKMKWEKKCKSENGKCFTFR